MKGKTLYEAFSGESPPQNAGYWDHLLEALRALEEEYSHVVWIGNAEGVPILGADGKPEVRTCCDCCEGLNHHHGERCPFRIIKEVDGE